MTDKNSIYWDINIPLSYNALFNAIIGARGVGKSYGVKERCINKFIEKGEKFAYLRRFKTELSDIGTFFNDIYMKYPDHEFEVKGKSFLIDGEEAGKCFALSTAKIKKSNSYPLITTIIFDEFILDSGYHHYIPDEVVNFLEFYETIARMREVKVFLISNAITWTNPYFTFFELDPPKSKKGIAVNNDFLVQVVQNKKYSDVKEKTRFGKMLKGTSYGNYAFKNEFLRDSTNFVLPKSPENMRMHFIMKVIGRKYGVWIAPDEGIYYVSKKFDPKYKLIYTAMNEDHEPNTLLLKGRNKSTIFKDFVDQYKYGSVYFDSIDTKNIMLKILKIAM